MLRASYRLQANQIQTVLQRGRFKVAYHNNSKLFTLKYLPAKEHKFCFVVSTKVDKRATVRNRIKRRLRAVIYKLLQANEIKTGYYVLIAQNPDLAKIDFTTLLSKISESVKSLNR